MHESDNYESPFTKHQQILKKPSQDTPKHNILYSKMSHSLCTKIPLNSMTYNEIGSIFAPASIIETNLYLVLGMTRKFLTSITLPLT